MQTKLRTYKISGYKAKLHPECVKSFREDRKHGLIYGPYQINGKMMMNAEEASITGNFCPYCGKK